MPSTIPNLLRRTFLVASAALAFALALPAAAQQTILLTNQTAMGSCTYSGSVTVLPNGNLSVTCQAGTVTGALFSLNVPATIPINTAGNVQTTVTRSGGTGSLDVSYTVGGTGCASASSNINFPDATNNLTQPISISTTGTPGTCTVSISAVQSGNTVSPGTLNISVYDPNAPVSDCPTPQAGTITSFLGNSNIGGIQAAPYQLRMTSGQIAAIPVVGAIAPKVSVELTQGQQPATPAGVITEFSVSKCPGVIYSDPTDAAHYVAQCYVKSNGINFNEMSVYTAPRFTWTSQASLGGRGCWAPATDGQYYVNVRWTYASCPYTTTGGCGFSMQWSQGSY